MSRIVLASVSKVFGDGTQALRSLDLEVGDGELLVLVGPSGCGKTTALRMVAGLEDVTSGSILIDGRLVNDVEPRHRDVAMVFQSYALYPHLTVYDNMAFSLRYRKVPKQAIAARVAEAARILELEPYLRRKPRELSGGQRQRVAMGRAIVRQPRAFLMDEPLSNLDAKLRVQMRAEIAQLQRSLGTTTIYVTHDQTEAMTLGTRVAVLSAGVLAQVARPQELYHRPANLFVAGFIGSPPMNLINARLERGGAEAPDRAGGRLEGGAARPCVVFGPHRLPVPSSVLAAHPDLGNYLGERVVLGIRPEHMADVAHAGDTGAWCAVSLPIRLREELGAQVHVHAAIGDAAHTDSGPADDVRSLATIVARLDPRSAITEGQTAALAIDTAELHFFDPQTGASLRR